MRHTPRRTNDLPFLSKNQKENRIMQPKAIVLALLPLFSGAYATDTPANATETELNTIVVTAPFAQKMGTQRITQKQIQNRPSGNGTITDLLNANANIQFSNISGSSEAAGEIAPENVSFHGEKFYDNNWMIDGMSNNDNVNPGADNGYMTNNPSGTNADDLPAGGTQSFWVNADIIDSVDVYDSNISAKYGQFTGAVIDAKLKDPDLRKASGSISYRTSRDNWTQYHSKPTTNSNITDAETVQKAEQHYYQPQFTKNIYSINLNQPINERAGILFSYNRTESDIPYHHSYMDVWTDQKRLSETYVLKGTYKTDSGDTWKLTGLYSPHESKMYRANYKNGSFTNNGGGYRFNLEWKHLFDKGQVESYLGYKSTQNKVENESNSVKNWSLRARDRTTPHDYIDWASGANVAREGGFGTIETNNKTWTAKQDYQFDEFTLGNSKHSINLGWQADWAQASYRRYTDVYNYLQAGATAIGTASCLNGDDTCLEGDQYFSRRSVYPARSLKVGNNHYAAYFEDIIDWGKWQITPGLRIDHDRFLKNTDFAPRFTASYDVFGNNHTKIFGGLNRYYANSMLSYKLREGIRYFYEERRSAPDADWTVYNSDSSSGLIKYRYPGSLKTPRSDEINLGLYQIIGNSEWTLKWVQRHGKDQFAMNLEGTVAERNRSYVMNNNGSSSANTFTLTANMRRPLEFKYATIDISGGAAYSRNKTNITSYESQYDEDTANEMILMDGKLSTRDGIKATDYNNPWKLFANISTDFPKLRLNWSQRLNYTAGYSAWSSTSGVCSADLAGCGSYTGDVDIYTREKFKDIFTVDWRFTYKQPIYKKQTLDLTLDIINVFNTVAFARGSNANNASTTGRVTYKLGRQFWLGARYAW